MSKKYTTIPREVIISALDKLDAYIRPTYGPAGRGILVGGMYPKMLDDGYMAIDEFELDDPLENEVINFVKAASFQANKRAGDGTTSATLLMIAIVREGIKSGKALHELLADLSVGKAEAIGVIYQTRRLVESRDDLEDIAFNAYKDANSAEIVADVVGDVGPDGVIAVEGGEALSTTSEVVVGMNIPNGFYSPYLANDAGKVVIEDPYILLTTRRVQTNGELLPIVQRIVASGTRKLLIVGDGVENEALTTLIMNNRKGSIEVMAVKAPYNDVAKKNFLDDLAIVTGATIADDALGMQLENLGLGALGHADKVIITKEETLIIGGKGDKAQLDARVAVVRKELDEQPNNDAIQTRLARLTGGIGVIKVGASTEAEIATKKAKIEDAVRSTQLAFKTGVVAGGAKSFLVETSCTELNYALKYPRQVLEDNGEAVLTDDSEDAYDVVVSAIDSGVSIASLLLNCGGIITKV